MTPSEHDKRQLIVRTAYDLFKRDGFHATGIDRIIAEARVAKMTMYRHFPSKDKLIIEVLERRAERFARQLDDLALADATPAEKVTRVFDWHAAWFRRRDFHGCLFAHAIAEYGDVNHPVHRAAAAQKIAMRNRLAALLEETPPAAVAKATVLVMLIEGATLLAQLGHGDEAITAAKGAALQLISPAPAA
ncbi:TetR/AcrR family transcriptional regulator [Segnochrobactrum spirostomi]|uniref:TetR/AcrR family transcriptional regulator n=1 Tax=Segnochrobactrum spirostomi TaxID=2608987 RepID=A0A6A7Y6U3_9HYPH|nr:TetR/AcrR family transcriptional regulator [Segnochrobactrum spirostomi]MQT15050.1 TetR/AcrR family transcriptional regulator [Segnochrobactrum spirostomi]